MVEVILSTCWCRTQVAMGGKVSVIIIYVNVSSSSALTHLILLYPIKASYNHYADVRGDIALPKADLLPIDAGSNQVCSTFGLHPNFPHLKSMYDNGDLLWVANMGVLQQYCTESDWRVKTSNTALFAHNIQYDETHSMDIFEEQAGTGVGGRMADVLKKNGFSSTTASLHGVADALIALQATNFILDPILGLQDLNPRPSAQPLWENMKKLNAKTKLGSNLFGETWANTLFKSKGEIEPLKDAIDGTNLTSSFPDDGELGAQLELVAKLIKTGKSRGKIQT